METTDARQNTQRALNALSAATRSLDTLNNNWSMWDDCYNYVQNPSSDFTDSNTSDSAFTSASLNVILILDDSGKIIYSKGFDLAKNQEVPISTQSLSLMTDPAIIHLTDAADAVTGIVSLPENPMIISSRPIIHSNGDGPVAGTILMGQYLDSTMVQTISKTANLPITLAISSDKNLAADFQLAATCLSEKDPVFVQTSG